MFGLKRSEAWKLSLLLTGAAMTSGQVLAQESRVLNIRLVDTNDGEKKSETATPEPEGKAGDDVLEAKPAKQPGTRTIRGGQFKIVSPDGKTFEIIAPGEGVKKLQANVPFIEMERPGGPPRFITILRNGDTKTVEIRDLDRLIRELAGRTGEHAATEAPKFLIGVSVSEAPEVVMTQLKKPDVKAVVVNEVLEDSPAAKAGVQNLDLILKAGDKPLSSPLDLTQAVKASEGGEIALVLMRTGKELTVHVTPKPNEQAAKPVLSDDMIHFGPGLMERRMLTTADPLHFSHSNELKEEIKALRDEIGELKKLVEELKTEK